VPNTLLDNMCHLGRYGTLAAEATADVSPRHQSCVLKTEFFEVLNKSGQCKVISGQV